MPDRQDIDSRLAEAGAHWRTADDGPTRVDWDVVTRSASAGDAARREREASAVRARSRRGPLAWTAVAAAVVAVTLGLVFMIGSHSSPESAAPVETTIGVATTDAPALPGPSLTGARSSTSPTRSSAALPTPSATGSPTPSAPAGASTDPTDLVGVTWAVRLVDGVPLAGTGEYSMRFESTGTVHGKEACNTFNGRAVLGAGTLTFGDGTQTTAYCGGPVPRPGSLSKGTYHWYRLGDDLHLTSPSGQVLVLEPLRPALTTARAPASASPSTTQR